ncbi:hypothetical protein OIU76_000425 [Salix suchowensis]|nr:hypothetical protein OIU76_000425 [Salix suchowensis]
MVGRKPLVCSFPAGFRYRPGLIQSTIRGFSELPDHCAGRLTTSIISDMANSRFLVYFRKIESLYALYLDTQMRFRVQKTSDGMASSMAELSSHHISFGAVPSLADVADFFTM